MNTLLAIAIALCGILTGYHFGMARGLYTGHIQGHDCEAAEREVDASHADDELVYNQGKHKEK